MCVCVCVCVCYSNKYKNFDAAPWNWASPGCSWSRPCVWSLVVWPRWGESDLKTLISSLNINFMMKPLFSITTRISWAGVRVIEECHTRLAETLFRSSMRPMTSVWSAGPIRWSRMDTSSFRGDRLVYSSLSLDTCRFLKFTRKCNPSFKSELLLIWVWQGTSTADSAYPVCAFMQCNDCELWLGHLSMFMCLHLSSWWPYSVHQTTVVSLTMLVGCWWSRRTLCALSLSYQ